MASCACAAVAKTKLVATSTLPRRARALDYNQSRLNAVSQPRLSSFARGTALLRAMPQLQPSPINVCASRRPPFATIPSTQRHNDATGPRFEILLSFAAEVEFFCAKWRRLLYDCGLSASFCANYGTSRARALGGAKCKRCRAERTSGSKGHLVCRHRDSEVAPRAKAMPVPELPTVRTRAVSPAVPTTVAFGVTVSMLASVAPVGTP